MRPGTKNGVSELRTTIEAPLGPLKKGRLAPLCEVTSELFWWKQCFIHLLLCQNNLSNIPNTYRRETPKVFFFFFFFFFFKVPYFHLIFARKWPRTRSGEMGKLFYSHRNVQKYWALLPRGLVWCRKSFLLKILAKLGFSKSLFSRFFTNMANYWKWLPSNWRLGMSYYKPLVVMSSLGIWDQ